MNIKLCCGLLLGISSAAYARPRTVTVHFDEANLMFDTLQLREQTTRPLLAGCLWPDILQRTGWFPATFYTSVTANLVDAETVSFPIGKRSALAKYCGAENDNVSNTISFRFPIVETGLEAYGSIPFTVGTSKLTEARVVCRYAKAENEEHGQFSCENASLKNDGDLTILVTLVK